MPCIFFLHVFEGFVLGHSAFVLSLLALFGKIQKQLFFGMTSRGLKNIRFGQFLLILDKWTIVNFFVFDILLTVDIGHDMFFFSHFH